MKPTPASREASPGYPTRRQVIHRAGTLGLAAFGLAANAQASNADGRLTAAPQAPPSPPVAPPGEIRLRGDVAPVTEVPPKPDPGAYIVRQGDTLASIAKKQLGDEKRAAEIAKANPGLDPNKALVTGQKIKLPVAAPAAGAMVRGKIKAVD